MATDTNGGSPNSWAAAVRTIYWHQGGRTGLCQQLPVDELAWGPSGIMCAFAAGLDATNAARNAALRHPSLIALRAG